MSVARLKKVSLVGPVAGKPDTLAALQQFGCMHVVPLTDAPTEPEKTTRRDAEDAYKALRFLSEISERRRPVSHAENFAVDDFVNETLALKQQLRDAGDRRDFLAHRIDELRPWGELNFPTNDELGGHRLWFYQLPFKARAALEAIEQPWEVVATDTRFLYIAVVSPDEPADDLLPVPRTHVGSVPRSALVAELEDTEVRLEALQAERIALTRYLSLLRNNLSAAETRAELDYALAQTRDDDKLFAVQGWVPEHGVEAVRQYAESRELAVMIESPQWNETPPTLLLQPGKEAAGVDLAMFYQVPNYRDWDPTRLLEISFAIFFAMIVADAGYGEIILAGLLIGWNKLEGTIKLQAWRRLGLLIAGTTIAYGVLIGSFFGMPPPEGSIRASLAVLDLNDFDSMMRLSILVGLAHLVFAIGMHAWTHRDRRSSRAQLGWIGGMLGGVLLWLSGQTGVWAGLGVTLLLFGIGSIIWFTSERPIERPRDWAWRLFDGVKALNGIMGAFGDILSYMRLFALGLASASLAITFNDLSAQVRAGVPGLGTLLGILIFLVGHVLNFGLALMSGVVHGLRLNYIEFFKWGLPDEGVAFRPLTRKEVTE